MALNMATASHFPSTSSPGRAGVINSGSSDCLLAFAGGDVRRDRHPSHHCREKSVVREKEQHEGAAIAEAWRDRWRRRRADCRPWARHRATAVVATPIAGCRRAAAPRPRDQTVAPGRASGRTPAAPCLPCRRPRRFRNAGRLTSTTSSSPPRTLRLVVGRRSGQRDLLARRGTRLTRARAPDLPTGSFSSRALSIWSAISVNISIEHQSARRLRPEATSPAACAGRAACRAVPCVATATTRARRRAQEVEATWSCGKPFAAAEQRHESILERRRARLRDQFRRRCPRRSTRPRAEDDDAVAQRSDLLHHVRREQQAAALAAQSRAAVRAARARS